MKALLFVKTGSEEGAYAGVDMRVCLASLDALGITHHKALASELASYSTEYINSHDFIVIPSMLSGYNLIVDDSRITIPMFGLGCSAGAAGYGITAGVTSSAGGALDEFVEVDWSNEEYIACFGHYYTLGTGAALATSAATEPSGTGGAAQAAIGKVIAWSQATGGASKLYCSSHRPSSHAYLPFLIQHAIDDGLLTSTPRKAPIVVDLDHINGKYASLDLTVIPKIASYVPAGGVVWAGIFNADNAYFLNMSADVKAQLQHYSGSPFKYCWHDHTLNPLINDNTDVDGHSTDYSKTVLSNLYAADKALWESHGLVFHEENAYYNCGSNSWEENTLELFSPDISYTSSPGNDNTQAGYGFVAFRGGSDNARRHPDDKGTVYTNILHNKRKVRGIQIFPTWDMCRGSEPFPDLDMPYDSIVDWRKNFNYVCNAVSMCQSIYLHDEDFGETPSQSPGVGQHGFVQMQIIADTGKFLSDVSTPFADLGEYVSKANAR